MNAIGIVTPLVGELRTITNLRISTGKWRKVANNTLASLSGAGFYNARCSGDLLLSNGARALISWGCAAATAADLRPGDLILPSVLISEQEARFKTDGEWRQAISQNVTGSCRIFSGSMLSVDRLITGSREKQALALKYGVVALDMESASLAELAHERGIPFMAVRAIVDPADMDLPLSIASAMDQEARVNHARLLASLFAHPGEIPGLIRLGKNFRRAQNTLKLVWKTAMTDGTKPADNALARKQVAPKRRKDSKPQTNRNEIRFVEL